MIRVRRALPHDVARYYSREPTEFHGLFHDGEPLALGGFQIRGDRTYVFLDVQGKAKQHGMRIVRAALKTLMERNETVYAPCAAHLHEGAERLLTWLGFRPTDEVLPSYAGEMRVWVWHRWEI